jgi:hypothetical protein
MEFNTMATRTHTYMSRKQLNFAFAPPANEFMQKIFTMKKVSTEMLLKKYSWILFNHNVCG